VCTASDQCHDAGVCIPLTGCTNPAKADGSACNDSNACTQTDTCQSGACSGGNPVVCTASDQCHDVGVCNPGTGLCSNPASPNGTACNDGNACTTPDTCSGGVCSGTPAPPPAEVTNSVTLAKGGGTVTITWSAAAGSTASDVVRGLLSALPVGPGGGDETCLAPNTGLTSADDGADPAVGTGFWYLVRGETVCAAGSYGTEGFHGAPSTPRATTTCPAP